MRFSVIIFSAILLTACGSSKNSIKKVKPKEETSNTPKNNRVIGIVREQSKGCGFCIQTEIEPGVTKFLFPLNLEDTFKQEGTKIKFEFAINRKLKPSGCTADLVVKVYDVSRMRKN